MFDPPADCSRRERGSLADFYEGVGFFVELGFSLFQFTFQMAGSIVSLVSSEHLELKRVYKS